MFLIPKYLLVFTDLDNHFWYIIKMASYINTTSNGQTNQMLVHSCLRLTLQSHPHPKISVADLARQFDIPLVGTASCFIRGLLEVDQEEKGTVSGAGT